MIPLDQDFNTVEAQLSGQYTPPPSGGYIFKVLKSEEKISKAQNPMVAMELDIIEGDFKGAFEKYPAKYTQGCTGASTPYFKGMLTSFKVSNPQVNMSAVVQNNQFNPQGLVGLIIGGCLREEEYYNDAGELKTIMKIQYLCDTEFVRQGHVKPNSIKKAQKPVSSDPFPNPLDPSIPPHTDVDLPF